MNKILKELEFAPYPKPTKYFYHIENYIYNLIKLLLSGKIKCGVGYFVQKQSLIQLSDGLLNMQPIVWRKV